MKQTNTFLLCIMSLLMVGCSNDEEPIVPTPEAAPTSISWSVLPVDGMQNTRALINSNAGLQDACANGTGEGIGIWGDYDLTINGVKSTIEGFMNDVKLVYYGISATEDSPTGWDYMAKDQYWELGGQYRFRAYYPQTAIHDHVLPSSNATTFVINYNTT